MMLQNIKELYAQWSKWRDKGRQKAVEAWSAEHGEQHSEQYSDQDVLFQITNPDRGKGAILKKIGITLLSLAIFAGIGLFRSTWSELVILIIVLFVHEAGHLIAMKLFKYSDVKMLFLPLMGAVITSRDQSPYSARRALVSIAGPMPGLLIGLFFAILYATTHQRQYFDIASMFIFLNAFNLLPLYPLDGGSFFDSILFSRNYIIEVIFKIITSLLLIALVISLQAWVLILIPVVILFSLKSSYYVYKAAKGLKSELALENIDTLKLTEELVGKIRARLDEKAFAGKKTLKNLAALVDSTWQRIFTIPPRLFKTLSLLLLYGFSLCLIAAAFFGLALSPDKGTLHLQKGEYDLAISEFSKKLETNPNDAGALYGRGMAYQLKGLSDQADSDFNKAFEMNPKDFKAYSQRGAVYAVKGQYDQAISHFNKALEINPNHAGIYLNRGLAYHMKGQNDQAISDFSKAIEIDPNYAEAYDNRGGAHLAKGQFDQAITDRTKAIDINPKLPGAYGNRGITYTKKGEYDHAISDFNKALEITPKDAQAYGNRARAYYFQKEYDKSWEDAKKAQDLGYQIPADFLDDLRKASGRQK
jgi:tetratricopeptide (TPR) repeat protein